MFYDIKQFSTQILKNVGRVWVFNVRVQFHNSRSTESTLVSCHINCKKVSIDAHILFWLRWLRRLIITMQWVRLILPSELTKNVGRRTDGIRVQCFKQGSLIHYGTRNPKKEQNRLHSKLLYLSHRLKYVYVTWIVE